MKKRITVSLLAAMSILPSMAQVSATLSPYSQYGLGNLSEQSVGFNRGMGGVAYGLRSGKYVNMQNPASYAAIDSLSMIFDAGVSGQMSNYKEGGKSLNTKTGSFDYAVAGFRLLRHVGMAVGVVPYTNIGYSYAHSNAIGSASSGSAGSEDPPPQAARQNTMASIIINAISFFFIAIPFRSKQL